MFGGRLLRKNVELVPKVFSPVRQCSAAKQHELGVKIPDRIERSSTDILKALASTVGRDITSFPYKYPDDPYFYSYSAYEKRLFALSLESGRKSARWIVENNPGFFKNQLSEPMIPGFLPKKVYDEDSKVTEETLVGVIERREVLNAITVYNLLLQNGIVISDNLKQSLLELVCFYNCQDKPNEEELESKWFSNIEHQNVEINTWMESGFAESLFESMNPNCPLANAAIIQGMIKYNCVQKAFEIYRKAKSNNVKFPIGVYNALLSQASNNSVDIADGYTFIKELLNEMSAEGIRPNQETLNSALKSLQYLHRIRRNGKFVKDLLMDFIDLEISPSLGTYFYLIQIFGIPGAPKLERRKMLKTLLDIIEATTFEVKHPCDFVFFPYAMNYFTGFFKDIGLANQLHRILLKDENVKFLENSFSESMYFRNYLCYVFNTEPLEIAFEKYKEVVPAIYSPEPIVLSTVLSSIAVNSSAEYLALFWSDVKRFKANKIMQLLTEFLRLVKVSTDEAVLKVVHEAAICALDYLEVNNLQRINQEVVSLALISFMKAEDIENALKLFDLVKEFKYKGSLITEEALMVLFQYALAQKDVALMLNCLKYAQKEAYWEIGEMAGSALPFLGEGDRIWVSLLVNKKENIEESPE